MGLAYVPQSTGKGATSGPVKFYNPKLAGGYSRAGAIYQGLQAGYRFVTTNYKLFTGIGSVGIGAAISGTGDYVNIALSQNVSTYQRKQALRSSSKYRSNKRRYKRAHRGRCHCCTCN